MKKLFTVVIASILFMNVSGQIPVTFQAVKATINADYSVTFTQDIPSGMPTTITTVDFYWVSGTAPYVLEGTLTSASIFNNQMMLTTAPCALVDSIQFAASTRIYLADPSYIAYNGQSTNFWRRPGITYQSGYATTGTDIPHDGSCPSAPTSPGNSGNSNGNGNGGNGGNNGHGNGNGGGRGH